MERAGITFGIPLTPQCCVWLDRNPQRTLHAAEQEINVRASRRVKLATAAFLVVSSSQAATLLPPLAVVSTCGENTAQALFAMNAIDILRVTADSRLQRFLLSYERCSAEFDFMSPLLNLGDAGWTVEPLSVSIDTNGLPRPDGCVTITSLARDHNTAFCFDDQGKLSVTATTPTP